MQTKKSLRVLIAILVSLLTQLVYPQVTICAPPDVTGGGSTNEQVTSANTNMVIDVSYLYKTIVDKVSGQYAVVDTNKEVVLLKDNTGRVIWSANVAKALSTVPISGERKIHNMEMIKGDLIVTFSRGFAKIDRENGSIIWLGSD